MLADNMLAETTKEIIDRLLEGVVSMNAATADVMADRREQKIIRES